MQHPKVQQKEALRQEVQQHKSSHQKTPRRPSRCPAFLCKAVLLASVLSYGTLAFAAGNTLRLDNDPNSRIEVGNAITQSGSTTLFLWSWPDMGDANSGKPCALNFYSLQLKPGLASLQPQLLAGNVCTSIPGLGGLLADGDGLILANDQLQRWRSGEQVSHKRFNELDATKSLGINSNQAGMQFFDITATGDVVIAAPVMDQNSPTGISLRLTRLNPDGKQSWQTNINDLGATFTIEDLWAANDGDALLYLTSTSATSLVPVMEPQLIHFSTTGKPSIIELVEVPKPFDMSNITAGSQEELKKFFEQQKNSKPEKIKRLAARGNSNGGFDVFFHRVDGKEGRTGHFLQHIAADGSLQSETALGSQIVDYGLENWVDFYLAENQLVLLSTVMATQEGVSTRRKKWPQNVVSWIDLDSGIPDSRLIPLNERYLEAAMNAGDEGQQHLEGQPGGEALMLTTLAGKPVVISRGYINGKFTLRIHEATDDLLVFTETMDEQQQALAKQQAREKRNADKVAQIQHINKEMAESVGMTPEAFAALSKKERTELIIRQGDPELLQSLMQEYMQAAQAYGQMQGQPPGQMPGQAAEQAAGQATNEATEQRTGDGSETNTNSVDDSSNSAKVLALDAGMRAFIEYQDAQSRPVTLLIVNLQNQQELLRKDYVDGNIYEYIDFGRFQLPLKQINVKYLNENGEVLEDLTPAIGR